MIRISKTHFILECREDIDEACSVVKSDVTSNGDYGTDIEFRITGCGKIEYPMCLVFESLDRQIPFMMNGHTEALCINAELSGVHEDFRKVYPFIKLGVGIKCSIEEKELHNANVMISVSGEQHNEPEHIELKFNIAGTTTGRWSAEGEDLTSESGNGAKNGYVSVTLHPQDATIINDWATRCGVANPIEPEKLHATLYYAQGDANEVEIDPEKVYVVRVKEGIHRMGNAGSEWEALTVHLEGDDLESRHMELRDLMGQDHSYPDYMAHLSLKYRPDEGDEDRFASNPFPLETLRFTSEKQEDIRP